MLNFNGSNQDPIKNVLKKEIRKKCIIFVAKNFIEFLICNHNETIL